MQSVTAKDVGNLGRLETDYLNKSSESLFYTKYEPTAAFSKCRLPFLQSNDGAHIVFQIGGDETQLCGSFLVIRLPTIEIKPQYKSSHKVRWCDNVAHNICEHILVENKNAAIQGFDPKSLDMISQFEFNSEQHKLYNYMVGNRKSLISPESILYEDTVMMPLKTFYSDTTNPTNSLTVGNLQYKPDFKHKIRMNNAVVNQLIVYEKQADGTYSAVNGNNRNKFVNITQANSVFNTPTLIGNYARLVASDEASHFKKVKQHFFSEAIHLSSDNKGQVDGEGGNLFTIPLDSIDGPVEAIYYGLENLTSSRFGVKSNYTVNSETYGKLSFETSLPDSYTEDDPCEWVSIGNGEIKRATKNPCFLDSLMGPFEDGSRAPTRIGLHKIAYKIDGMSKNPKGMVRFQKGEKFTIKLSDLGQNKWRIEDRHRYVLHIVVKVARILDVSNGLISKKIFTTEENKPISNLVSNPIVQRKPVPVATTATQPPSRKATNKNKSVVKVNKSGASAMTRNGGAKNGTQKRSRVKVKRSGK